VAVASPDVPADHATAFSFDKTLELAMKFGGRRWLSHRPGGACPHPGLVAKMRVAVAGPQPAGCRGLKVLARDVFRGGPHASRLRCLVEPPRPGRRPSWRVRTAPEAVGPPSQNRPRRRLTSVRAGRSLDLRWPQHVGVNHGGEAQALGIAWVSCEHDVPGGGARWEQGPPTTNTTFFDAARCGAAASPSPLQSGAGLTTTRTTGTGMTRAPI
jgi:hypothetical protein